ncbi:ATPase [Methanoculleus sediminis]|uniref:ATPase n=2 Tax=Methanoculleus sediminis TaxID=1550566 RepID=A0A0H1R2N8_9EURY|nr:ATPase [Methanoculleus sediminis]
MELVIGKDGDRDVAIDAQELVTGRTCVIAQSGAGKSWGIAVLCEQLLQARVGFCLIDTEGEYFSLRDRFPLLWIGSSDDCDVDIGQVNLRELMQNAICSRTAVIFDVSETDMQERVSYLAEVLYDLESELKQPFLLIVEEADKFIPQSGESIKKIEEISRRGRKRGLGLLVATQRPSLVTKNVLSQCNSQILGKLSIENDLKAVSLFFPSRKEAGELADLEPGEFFVMGKLSRENATKMRFGARLCEHRGLTPRLVPARPIEPARPARPPRAEPARAEPCGPEDIPREEPVEAPTAAANAVIPVLLREEALDIAKGKRKRRFRILEPEERIVSGERVYRPLHRVEVRYIGGLLRKATKTASFVIDGPTGCIVEVDRGMKVRPGFSELLGLDEAAVKIVAGLANGGSTLTEIEADTHLAPGVVKKAIKSLADVKLITEVKTVGDTKVYVPLLAADVPALSSLRRGADLPMESLREEPLEAKVTESLLRTILKGLEPTAEIVEFETIYYPVYLIRFASERGERSIVLDGCTGKELLFPVS